MQKIIPVTDLQRQAAQILDKLRKSNETVIITQRGRAAGVLMSTERYERFEAYFDQVEELELDYLIQIGLQEKAAGKMLSLEEAKRRLNYPG